MEALASKDENLIALTQKTDSLTKWFEVLFTRSDELTRRQLVLESTLDRLEQVTLEGAPQVAIRRNGRKSGDRRERHYPGVLAGAGFANLVGYLWRDADSAGADAGH